jgi:hypothetical protein
VFVITYFGENNPIDGAVLQVLLRKHEQIKNDLGVSVSIPGQSQALTKTLFENMLFKRQKTAQQLVLELEKEPEVIRRQKEWEDRSKLEKESRTRFAQRSLSPEKVQQELDEIKKAIGGSETVKRFVELAMPRFGSPVRSKGSGVLVHIDEQTPRSLRQSINRDQSLEGKFELPLEKGQVYLGRTGQFVEGLASFVIDQALDPTIRFGNTNAAARLGVIRSNQVSDVHHVLVLRQRYQLTLKHGEAPILAEEILTWAFTGNINAPRWLDEDAALALLEARPTMDLPEAVLDRQKELLLAMVADIQVHLDGRIADRAAAVLDAHERVREAQRVARKVTIEVVRPTDVLGVYKILPA